MNWILIGILSGMLVTGHFEDREACEGKLVVVREQIKGLSAQCVERPDSIRMTNKGCLTCSSGSR
jgi:hypothetical protein